VHKQDLASCFGELTLKRGRQFEDALAHALQFRAEPLGKHFEGVLSMCTPACSMRKRTARGKIDFAVDALYACLFDLCQQRRNSDEWTPQPGSEEGAGWPWRAATSASACWRGWIERIGEQHGVFNGSA